MTDLFRGGPTPPPPTPTPIPCYAEGWHPGDVWGPGPFDFIPLDAVPCAPPAGTVPSPMATDPLTVIAASLPDTSTVSPEVGTFATVLVLILILVVGLALMYANWPGRDR